MTDAMGSSRNKGSTMDCGVSAIPHKALGVLHAERNVTSGDGDHATSRQTDGGAHLLLVLIVAGFLLAGCGERQVDDAEAPWLGLLAIPGVAALAVLALSIDLWRLRRGCR